jgi:riboflavin kinase/FMN adenylyltransferase
MKVLRGPWADWSVEGRLAVAVGVFDGVHMGHRAVLTRFRDEAVRRGLTPGVVTFDRHPISLVAPDRAPKMLSTVDQRIEQFVRLGAEVVAVLPFDENMRMMDPRAFVTDILAERLHAGLVVVGEDFRFGRDRRGDPDMLRAMGADHGFDTQVLELVGDDEPISSTRIRALLADGDVVGAAELLGRRYQLMGEVVEGRGGSLVTGVPTANIDVSATVAIPRRGVYAAFAGVGEMLPGVANVGVRPTFGEGIETIEVHLLDGTDDLRGRILRVDFVERLRDEERFVDGEALADQIAHDVTHAREVLGRQTP